MKRVCVAALAIAACGGALAQSTIYKHVDENGRITYTNRPMKGATAMALDPITIVPGLSGNTSSTRGGALRPAALTVVKPSLASVDPQLQRRRDDDRRRILESELAREEEALSTARTNVVQEQQNPILIAAVRTAQQVSEPTPTQAAELRTNIERASGRIRGLQSTVSDHERNVEALRKELGALKP